MSRFKQRLKEEQLEQEDVIYTVDRHIGDCAHTHYATTYEELKLLIQNVLSDYHIIELEIDIDREYVKYKYDWYGDIEEGETSYNKIRRIKRVKTTLKQK